MNIELKIAIIKKFGSQADFAFKMHEHESTVSRVVRGRRPLSPEQKMVWAKALDCNDPSEIFE